MTALYLAAALAVLFSLGLLGANIILIVGLTIASIVIVGPLVFYKKRKLSWPPERKNSNASAEIDSEQRKASGS